MLKIYQANSDYLAYLCACSDKLPWKQIQNKECVEHLTGCFISVSQNQIHLLFKSA